MSSSFPSPNPRPKMGGIGLQHGDLAQPFLETGDLRLDRSEPPFELATNAVLPVSFLCLGATRFLFLTADRRRVVGVGVNGHRCATGEVLEVGVVIARV